MTVVRGSLPAGAERATARELHRLHWKLTGLAAAPRLLLRRSAARLDAEQRRYLERLARVYEEIGRLSGCGVVVDASKRPLHGLLLAAVPSLDVRDVHLVRDSRAVVASQLRGRSRRSVPHLAARWLVLNLLCEAVARTQATHLRLRYEDFCARPQSSLATIASFADRSFEPIRILPHGQVQLEPGHGAGGDAVRFRRGVERIAASEAWRVGMDPRARRAVTWMTRPLLTRYGYVERAPTGRGER